MSFNEEKKVNATLVLEIVGRPKEYLVETLENMIKQISTEKGVVLKNKEIKDPVEMEKHKGMFGTFAEVEVETENPLYLIILIFKYMPSHVEVISPQNISFSNAEIGDVLSELTRRLHGYEEVARVLQNEKIILENKLREILGQKNEAKVEDKEEEKKKGKKKK